MAVFGASGAVSLCANSNAIGIEREITVDTAGGPLFGSQQYADADILGPQEVVLTFDDGPWPVHTPAVLAALAQHCTKATFFPIGKHALLHPEILKEIAAAGHTIGGHTWSHPYLSHLTPDAAVDEIEKGFSAIKVALGGTSPAPSFVSLFLTIQKQRSRIWPKEALLHFLTTSTALILR